MSAVPKKWVAVMAIPGIDLPSPVRAGVLAAVGSGDDLFAQALSTDLSAARLASGFSTPFGEKFKPSLVLSYQGSRRVRVESLVAFRNLIAVPHVIGGRIKKWSVWQSSGPVFSDHFDLYPVAPTKDPDSLIIDTATYWGLHEAKKFGGQPAPTVLDPRHTRVSPDADLLDALLTLDSSTARSEAQRRFKLRVRRSLEFAFHALRAPVSYSKQRSDRAVALSLWVSAFEVLVHPDVGDVNSRHVTGVIKQIPWSRASLRRARYKPIGLRGVTRLTTRPVQTYLRLSRLRNAFLHGESFKDSSLEGRRHHSWGSLDFQIPALYRCFLMFLLGQRGFAIFPPAEGNTLGRFWLYDVEEILAKAKPRPRD
jgi:hypothetical protein